MAQENNRVKTKWIDINASAPLIVFIALPIVLLTFVGVHQFKDDYITILLLSLVGIIVITFLILVIFKPANLLMDNKSHLIINKEKLKNIGGSANG